jgi:hypothetical protein
MNGSNKNEYLRRLLTLIFYLRLEDGSLLFGRRPRSQLTIGRMCGYSPRRSPPKICCETFTARQLGRKNGQHEIIASYWPPSKKQKLKET